MSLRCGCIEGFLTNEEHHESWCPAITGNFDGLPRLWNPRNFLEPDPDPDLDTSHPEWDGPLD